MSSFSKSLAASARGSAASSEKSKAAIRSLKYKGKGLDEDDVQLAQVKDKVRKEIQPPAEPQQAEEEEEGDVDIVQRTAVELTDKEELKIHFSEVSLGDPSHAVLDVVEDVEAFPTGQFATDTEKQQAKARAQERFARTANLPVKLLLTRLQGRKARGKMVANFASMMELEYGAFHAALQVGNVILEWNNSSLVIPRKVGVETPIFQASIQRHSRWINFASSRSSEATAGASLGKMDFVEEIDLLFTVSAAKEELVDKLIDVIIRYNKKYHYHVLLRNCQHFVLDAMKALGIIDPPKFVGKLRDYFEKLRERKSKKAPSEFTTHTDLDAYIMEHLKEIRSQDDMEYYLCQYFSFHVKAGMGDDPDVEEWKCQEPTCQMAKLEKQINQETMRLLQYKIEATV